jgi:hypothetical protein
MPVCVSFMTAPLVRLACNRLRLDERRLARRLGVTIGCLRSWDDNEPPYARLALSALIVGLDSDLVSRLDARRVNPETAQSG